MMALGAGKVHSRLVVTPSLQELGLRERGAGGMEQARQNLQQERASSESHDPGVG